MSVELKALSEEIKKTVQDFQKANDERIAKVEAGLSTAATSDKIESLNARITELQALQDEALKQITHLQVSGTAPSVEDRETVRLQARQFFARKRGSDEDPNMPVRDVDVEAYQAYCKAWPDYLRRGQQALDDPQIRAAMQVGSDPDGGYWVPTQKMQEVITRLHETSDVRAVADVMSITGDSVEWPNDVNKATSGGWVGETATRSETATPTVGMQSIYVREQYAEPHATQKLLDMSTINVEAWLAGKIAEILMLTENTAFVAGNGIAKPRGFMDYGASSVTTDDATRAWGVLQYVPTGAAGAIPNLSGSTIAHDANCFITTVSKLKPAYRNGAIWVMSRGTEATIRKMKDIDGRYLINLGTPQGSFTGFDLGGFPIRTMEDMPAIGSNSYSVAFGNFRMGYQIVDGRGIRILRDPFTSKPFVKFYTTKWTGGDVKNFDALKLMKFAAS